MTITKLRIACLIDSLDSPGIANSLVDFAEKNQSITIDCLIVHGPNRLKKENSLIYKTLKYIKNRGLYAFLGYIFLQLITNLEKNLISKTNIKIGSKKKVDFKNIEIINMPTPISKNNLCRIDDNDVKKIKERNIDLLIRCGSTILKGPVLNCTKLGILSIHAGDNNRIRGLPAGFWEVYFKLPKTGFIIQKLNEDLDAGNVLFRGSIKTRKYYTDNSKAIRNASLYFLKKVILDFVEKKVSWKFEEKLPYGYKIYKNPSIIVLLKYIFNSIKPSIQFRFHQKLFNREKVWKVCYQNRNWRNLQMSGATIIKNPKNSFLADPFLFKKEGKNYCFVENFSYVERKGIISVYEIGKNSYNFIGNAVEEKFHLSFPFVFEDGNDIYMIPESNKNNDIRLYKCLEFPLRWTLDSILMKNINAVDSIVFFKNDYWWLLTTVVEFDGCDKFSCLHIYYSKDLKSNNWIPHKKNPIYIDPSKSRNGGIVFEDNKIFRIVQNHKFNQYGNSMSIYRIDYIDQFKFNETFVHKIKPNFFKNLIGTHHLNNNEDYTVFDFCKFESLNRMN